MAYDICGCQVLATLSPLPPVWRHERSWGTYILSWLVHGLNQIFQKRLNTSGSLLYRGPCSWVCMPFRYSCGFECRNHWLDCADKQECVRILFGAIAFCILSSIIFVRNWLDFQRQQGFPPTTIWTCLALNPKNIQDLLVLVAFWRLNLYPNQSVTRT